MSIPGWSYVYAGEALILFNALADHDGIKRVIGKKQDIVTGIPCGQMEVVDKEAQETQLSRLTMELNRLLKVRKEESCDSSDIDSSDLSNREQGSELEEGINMLGVWADYCFAVMDS